MLARPRRSFDVLLSLCINAFAEQKPAIGIENQNHVDPQSCNCLRRQFGCWVAGTLSLSEFDRPVPGCVIVGSAADVGKVALKRAYRSLCILLRVLPL